MLSIIVPTFNEEDNLPLLLDSIKRQRFDKYEVIVADAGSQDRTRDIARAYNCRVVAGGLPARGRNEGAEAARGDLLLFLDADILLGDDFLHKALREFDSKRIDVGSFCLEPQNGNLLTKSIINLFYNWPIRLCEPFLPHGAQAILVKRAVHEQVRGFDEEVTLAEDHDYMRRAEAIGKFGILRSQRVFISLRRFQRDGWLRTYFKYFVVEIHMIFFGAVKSDVIKYRFGHYGER